MLLSHRIELYNWRCHIFVKSRLVGIYPLSSTGLPMRSELSPHFFQLCPVDIHHKECCVIVIINMLMRPGWSSGNKLGYLCEGSGVQFPVAQAHLKFSSQTWQASSEGYGLYGCNKL